MTEPASQSGHSHQRSFSLESLMSNASLDLALEQYMSTVPKTVLMMEDNLYKNQLPQDPIQLKDELVRMRELAARQHELIKRLRMELDIEHGHVKIMRNENEHLKKMNVAMMAEQEQEEEMITNKLLKKIVDLKKEKSDIMSKMEQEEEYITNNLQRRLTQLQKEKVGLEIAMENEQEAMLNRMTKSMDRRIKSPSGSTNALPSITPIAETSTELLSLKDKIYKVEEEYAHKIQNYQKEIDALKSELSSIKLHKVPSSTEFQQSESGQRKGST